MTIERRGGGRIIRCAVLAFASVLCSAAGYEDMNVHEKFFACLYREDSLCAENVLQMALGLNPKDAAAWNLMGVLRFSQEDNFAAIDAFRQAIEIDPRRSEARLFLGLAYLKSGADVQLTFEQWQWVAEHDPESLRKYGSIFGVPRDWQDYVTSDQYREKIRQTRLDVQNMMPYQNTKKLFGKR